MEEIWKDIQGYEGLYQVSNMGRIKSLERTRNMNLPGTKSLHPFEKEYLSLGNRKAIWL